MNRRVAAMLKEAKNIYKRLDRRISDLAWASPSYYQYIFREL